MVTAPGVVKFVALLPATDRGNTIKVTADPGTVVPGIRVQSTPTVHPAPVLEGAVVPTASPTIP
jgi:hypothetical protein